MATRESDSKHRLSGDWTIAGVVTQLDSLSGSLEKLAPGLNKKLYVDCAKINKIDMSGLQLLHVWIECAKMRGVKAKLVNLPDEMHRTIRQLGLGQCFTDSYPDAI